ncbi:hypothetical protein U1Q18_030167 [Sarracenia purpurea var. burkii]
MINRKIEQCFCSVDPSVDEEGNLVSPTRLQSHIGVDIRLVVSGCASRHYVPWKKRLGDYMRQRHPRSPAEARLKVSWTGSLGFNPAQPAGF